MWNALLEGLGSLLATFYDVVPNYGVAILMLTVLIRLAMFPLTIKQVRSMHTMQKLQPEIKKLQAKYKGKENRQKLTEETMSLYREAGASPWGGCLPLLLQLPVYFALFRVLDSCRGEAKAAGECITGLTYLPEGTLLHSTIEAGQATFLGMNLVTTPWEALNQGIFGFIPYALLVGLMVLTGWYQQKQTAEMQPAGAAEDNPMAAQMKTFGKVMPIMFGVFSFTFPAGLTVYWVASNIWTIGQQHFLMKQRTAEDAKANAAGAPGGETNEEQGKDPSKKPPHKGSGARKPKKKKRK